MDFAVALASAAQALNVVKQLREIDNSLSVADLNAKMADLYGNLAEVRMALTDAQEEVRKKDAEISAIKMWHADSARYELIDLYRGLFAYVLKSGQENGEPAHALCANCFQKGQRSILQTSGDVNVHQRSWDCPACKTKVKNQWRDMESLIKKSREKEV